MFTFKMAEGIDGIGEFFDLVDSKIENNFQIEKSECDYKLSIYSSVTKTTRRDAEVYYSVLKPFRVKCFEVAVELLHQIGVSYFVSYGTLLSVFRDGGVMIPYDHDTDLLIAEKDYVKVARNIHLLPSGYKMTTKCCETSFQWMRTRRQDITFNPENPQGNMKMLKIVDTRDYSRLLEEHRIKEGLSNPPQIFHCGVFTDFYTHRENSDYIIENISGPGMVGKTPFLKKRIFPTKTQIFEGIECQTPNDPEYVLTLNYGYLGKDFYYDERTFMYKKIGT